MRVSKTSCNLLSQSAYFADSRKRKRGGSKTNVFVTTASPTPARYAGIPPPNGHGLSKPKRMMSRCTLIPLRAKRPILQIDGNPAVYPQRTLLEARRIQWITKAFCCKALSPGGDILQLRRLIFVRRRHEIGDRECCSRVKGTRQSRRDPGVSLLRAGPSSGL